MNIVDYPLLILDNIFSHINTTDDHYNIRLTCKSFYNIVNCIKRYYLNKNIKELFFIINNKVNGYYITWHNNNIIHKFYFYSNNKKTDSNKVYYNNGNLKQDTLYKDNLKNGIEKNYRVNGGLYSIVYYKYNNKISERIYNIDGSLEFVKTYYNDTYYDLLKYKNDSIFISGTFIDNKIHNKLTIYFIDKKIIYKYNYGVLISKYIFDIHDNLIEKNNFKNNFNNGLCYTWYSNNNLKSIKCYNNNILTKIYSWSINHFNRKIININNNKLNGEYKIIGECIDFILPYKNNKLNGYIIIDYKMIDQKILIKFKNNVFANIYKKIYKKYGKRVEIIISNDYVSYIKYYTNGSKNYILKKKNNIYNFKYYNRDKKLICESTIL